MDKYTILVIEDELTINRIISEYFKKENYYVINAFDGELGLEMFSENSVDLICLDIMMPKVDGWEVAKRIRKVSDVPIIMMSALSEEDDLLRGYELKVDDYITKPFPPKVLVAKIKSLLEKRSSDKSEEDITRNFELSEIDENLDVFEENRKLKELLIFDDLTGVANRRYLDFYINNMFNYVKEFGSTFGILFFDIDKFKDFNDNYGHNIGDEVLKLVSKTIAENIRDNDLIGRWGGEEFLAVIKIDNIKDLTTIAEKLRILISKASYRINDETVVSVTVSIGGTLYKPLEEAEEFVDRADGYMYQAKETGRNRVVIKD